MRQPNETEGWPGDGTIAVGVQAVTLTRQHLTRQPAGV